VSRRLDWEKANRKDVVHEQGGEPVWQDFPDEAPRWLREEFDEDPERARRLGQSARRPKSEGPRTKRYTCSRCQLTLSRNQFLSVDPPVCRDCS
jgi:hypothetical protein